MNSIETFQLIIAKVIKTTVYSRFLITFADLEDVKHGIFCVLSFLLGNLNQLNGRSVFIIMYIIVIVIINFKIALIFYPVLCK